MVNCRKQYTYRGMGQIMPKVKKKTKNPPHRPKKYNIDPKKVEYLASIGCTQTEIAKMYGCNEDTIQRTYSESWRKGIADCKERLRKIQWKIALEGNPTMAIWLGKQYLGQTDKVEQTNRNIEPMKLVIQDKKTADTLNKLTKKKS